MIERKEFLALMAERRCDEAVIHTMGTVLDWPRLSNHPLDFFINGAMGYAASVGLGVALAQPERGVWIFDGDGSVLSNLGALVTAASNGRSVKLVHFVFENRLYELPGRVTIPGAEQVDFEAIARGAGIGHVMHYGNMDALRRGLDDILAAEEPTFVGLDIAPAAPDAVDTIQVMTDAKQAARRFAEAMTAGDPDTD